MSGLADVGVSPRFMEYSHRYFSFSGETIKVIVDELRNGELVFARVSLRDGSEASCVCACARCMSTL